jgi:hypothetical protein
MQGCQFRALTSSINMGLGEGGAGVRRGTGSQERPSRGGMDHFPRHKMMHIYLDTLRRYRYR